IPLLTQYEFADVEKIGLLKMDFLGLINLSIIENAVRFVQQRHGLAIAIEHLPLDDKRTYELLARGATTGVFQLESRPMRRHLQALQPSTIFDVSAMVALYRPGPMEAIPEFIERKHDPSKVT